MKLTDILAKRKMSYTQQEISLQIGGLAELMKQREKQLQLAVVNKSDVVQQKYLEEVDRTNDAIAVAQEILLIQLEKWKGKRK